MKKNVPFLSIVAIGILFFCGNSLAQHTFSIVAIDPATGKVGSAGATFVGGDIDPVISDIHPGVGAIHTQGAWNAANQNYARQLMNEGKSPQEIIDLLVANDVDFTPTTRQYIVIDFINGGRTAGHTGNALQNYKSHILKKTYAIAGNICVSANVLNNMESGFTNTTGTLADKLMAALQGAKEAGGDKRGASFNLSSLMSFMVIAAAQDTVLYLLVANPPMSPGDEGPSKDPVDELQDKYEEWKNLQVNVSENLPIPPKTYYLEQNYPNPFSAGDGSAFGRNPNTEIQFQIPKESHVTLKIFNTIGQKIITLADKSYSTGTHSTTWNGRDLHGNDVPSGIYFYQISTENYKQIKKLTLMR